MTLDILRHAVQARKKISLNLYEAQLDLIDETAKLTHTNRTNVIDALISGGFPVIFDQMEKSWNVLLISGNLDKKKKENISNLLKNLQKLKRKIRN